MDTVALPDLLRYQDLVPHGATRHRLDQLLEAGEYERIAPGVFLRTRTTDDTTAGWMAIAAKRAEATICPRSALVIYELTDEIPFQSEIAIPRGTQPVTLSKFHSHVGWHRFDPETFQIGRAEYVLPSGMSIGLYSAERTIVDLFRLSHQWAATTPSLRSSAGSRNVGTTPTNCSPWPSISPRHCRRSGRLWRSC